MKVLINSEISLGVWEKLLAENHFATPFQSPSFFRLINSCKSLSAEVFAIEVNNEIEALCLVTLQKESGIKRYFSRRAIIYGGPIIKENKPESLQILLQLIVKRYQRKAIYVEIRNINDYSKLSSIYIKEGWKYIPYLNIRVNCSSEEVLLNNLSNNRKRQIKKAFDSGATIKKAENIEEVAAFYTILHDLYQHKIKKPLLPRFFLFEAFNQRFCEFLLVVYKDNIIGGIMFPKLLNRCTYEFYVCGLDEEYKNQYPSILATWSVMQYSARNKIPVFDFMGAGIRGKDYGVREFKERFGGDLFEPGRYVKINNRLLYKIGEIYLIIIRILKNELFN